MRRFVTLLIKEWRDARVLIYAMMALVPIAHIAAETWLSHYKHADFMAQWLVPVAGALFTAVIASDLIAGDVVSGRAKSYASLPTRLGTQWSAKVVFLTIATVLFGAWTWVSAITVYATLAPTEIGALDAFARKLPDGLALCIALVPLGAAVLFFSTLLQRGFAAVAAGALLLAGIAGALVSVDWYDLELVITGVHVITFGATLTLLLLAGSFLAYTRGPVHSSSGLRRAAFACALPLGVLVPGGIVTASVVHARRDVNPGDPDIDLSFGNISPDGRYVALFAAPDREGALHRTWMLDLETDTVADLEKRDLHCLHKEWDEDGNYLAWRMARTERGRGRQPVLRQTFDPMTGKILKTRSLDQVAAMEDGDPWTGYGRWLNTRRQEDGTRLMWRGKNIEMTIEGSPWVRACPIPGFALHTTTHEVVFHDLEAGTSTVLHTSDEPRHRVSATFSPNGTYFQVWAGTEQAIYHTRSGRRVDRRKQDEGAYYWAGGPTDRFMFHCATVDQDFVVKALVDLETSRTVTLDMHTGYAAFGKVRVLPDGRMLAIVDRAVVMLDTDGQVNRTVYAPSEN